MPEAAHEIRKRDETRKELQAFITESNAAAVSLSQSTLKALLLLNGGAAIAMLGFVASVTATDSGTGLDLREVVSALQAYAVGAGLSVFATGTAYVVMYLQASVAQSYDIVDKVPYYANSPRTKPLRITCSMFHIGSVVIAALALAAFFVGVRWTGDIVLAAQG